MSEKLSPAQREAIQSAQEQLARAFPGQDIKKILCGPLAKSVCGELPSYSGLSDYKLTNVSTATVGSFVLCHGFDKALGEEVVVMIKRGAKVGEEKFGTPGGYTDLDTREQPSEGAVRELNEEVLDAAGNAILDVDPSRLELIVTGIDYRAVEKNGGLPVQYNGHAVALTDEEMRLVRAHVVRLSCDDGYKKAVQIQSNGEVANVLMVPLFKAARLSYDQFAHPHELEALKVLNDKLAPKLQRMVPHPLASISSPNSP